MERKIWIVWLLVICLLAGCAASSGFQTAPIYENEHYQLYRENGQMYLYYPGGAPKPYTGSGCIVVAPGYSFKTAEQMRKSIIDGSLVSEQYGFGVMGEGQTTKEICDIDALYQPKLPANVRITGVQWLGEYYQYTVRNDGFFAYLFGGSWEHYEERLEHQFYRLDGWHEGLLSDPENGTDTNLEEREHAAWRFVRHIQEVDGRKLYIMERYPVRSGDHLWPESKEPSYVYIFWQEGDQGFWYEVHPNENYQGLDSLYGLDVEPYKP